MKRAKIGDVYYVKVPNGYKLYQWAYSISKTGDYIRVFDGLYDHVPENIENIVAGPHSYIISFCSSRAYRIGLAKLIGNYSVPDKYLFPDYRIRFCIDSGKIWKIEVSRSNNCMEYEVFYINSIKELPLKYQNITLLTSCVTPNWLLYLFDVDFNLNELEKFFPGEDYDSTLHKYTIMVDEAIERYKNRNKK